MRNSNLSLATSASMVNVLFPPPCVKSPELKEGLGMLRSVTMSGVYSFRLANFGPQRGWIIERRKLICEEYLKEEGMCNCSLHLPKHGLSCPSLGTYGPPRVHPTQGWMGGCIVGGWVGGRVSG